MKQINEIGELQNAIDSSQAILVYFYNESCAPCVALRPKVQEMMEVRFEKMDLLFINSAQLPELSANFNVYSSPTIIVCFDGKENFRVSKYVSIQELSQKIQRYYDLLFS